MIFFSTDGRINQIWKFGKVENVLLTKNQLIGLAAKHGKLEILKYFVSLGF